MHYVMMFFLLILVSGPLICTSKRPSAFGLVWRIEFRSAIALAFWGCRFPAAHALVCLYTPLISALPGMLSQCVRPVACRQHDDLWPWDEWSQVRQKRFELACAFFIMALRARDAIDVGALM